MPRRSFPAVQFVLLLVAIASVAVALLLVGRWAVYEYVTPPFDTDRQMLLTAFESAFVVIGILAALAAITWYVMAWMAGVVAPENAGNRSYWLLGLLGVVLVSAITAGLVFGQPIASTLLGYALLVGSSALIYYVPTVLFTPASFKYSPVLAEPLHGLVFRRKLE